MYQGYCQAMKQTLGIQILVSALVNKLRVHEGVRKPKMVGALGPEEKQGSAPCGAQEMCSK